MHYYDGTQAQLHRAYALIQAHRHHEALQILEPICRHQPNNASAWWLAANALQHPQQVRYALQQVLRIAPNYPQAAYKLAQLNAASYPRPVTATPQRSNNCAWVMTIVSLIILSFSLIMGVLFYGQLQNLSPSWSQSFVDLVETMDAQPFVSQPTRQYQPSMLTPPGKSGPVATPDPAIFGDTYWEGNNDGITMEYFTINGRYRRFYQYPVKLYVHNIPTAIWAGAVDNALREIGQVVPIELTTNPDLADITLEILSPEAVQRRCVGLSFTARVVGCGAIDYQGGIVEPIIKGKALVSTDTNNPYGTVLHELLHTMGIVVHSPDPRDIMYYAETNQLHTTLTQRDINTLRRLYASPSYAD